VKHARKDYERIQDPLKLIPEGEPVFLLRAQDKLAPYLLDSWAAGAEVIGCKQDIIDLVRQQAQAMRDWQQLYCSKIPDLPS
jgi:hypothetical protein